VDRELGRVRQDDAQGAHQIGELRILEVLILGRILANELEPSVALFGPDRDADALSLLNPATYPASVLNYTRALDRRIPPALLQGTRAEPESMNSAFDRRAYQKEWE
jgi:hypothetical protein